MNAERLMKLGLAAAMLWIAAGLVIKHRGGGSVSRHDADPQVDVSRR